MAGSSTPDMTTYLSDGPVAGVIVNQTSEALGFNGLTPIAQRSGNITAVATTAATSTSPFGFTEAQGNAIITLVNELRATLVAYGLHAAT